MSAELKVVEHVEAVAQLPAQILVLPPNNLSLYLLCAPYLQRALEHTEDWAIEDVAVQYANGDVVLILCLNGEQLPFGAFCVEIVKYPKRKVLHVHLFGANDHTEELWMEWCWPQVQEWARAAGCAAAIGTGRDGWARKLHAKRKYLWEVPL